MAGVLINIFTNRAPQVCKSSYFCGLAVVVGTAVLAGASTRLHGVVWVYVSNIRLIILLNWK